MMLSCEVPQLLAINILQTVACADIRGSYEHEPIPSHCKSDLNQHLPLWCEQPTASYRLIAIGSDKVFKMGSERFITVGRNASAKVVLTSLSVSRMHAAFMHDALNQTFLVDLGSSHGTFIGAVQLKPYTPTLVTKKSLIKFGTCEIQYLLATICPEGCIARRALSMEADERDLFLNTQFNVISMLPVGDAGSLDESDLAFSRLDTFNFIGCHKIPPPLRVQISCESATTCVDNDVKNDSHVELSDPKMSCSPQYPGEVTGVRCPGLRPGATEASPLRFFGVRNDDLPIGNFSISISAPEDSVKSNLFVSAASLSNEPSIKRCATVAGVDEQETASFAMCEGIVDDESSLRFRRRRMSEDPHDYGSYDSSGRSMSMSLDCVDIASIGGSSTGFISSGSMSECEEGEDTLSEKRKRKVRFLDIPMEIPEPIEM